MTEITITITTEDARLIGEALAEMPFKRVSNLISSIQNQYDEQTKGEEPKAVKPDSYPYPIQRKIAL